MISLNAGTAISAVATAVSAIAAITGVGRLYQDHREMQRQTRLASQIIRDLSEPDLREGLNRLVSKLRELARQTHLVMDEMSEEHHKPYYGEHEPYRREQEPRIVFDEERQILDKVEQLARAVESLPVEIVASIPGAIDQVAVVPEAANRLRVVVTQARPTIVEIISGSRRSGSESYEQKFLRRSVQDLRAAIEAVERMILTQP